MQQFKQLAAHPTLIIGLLLIPFFGTSPVHADPGDETTYYLLTDHLGSIDVVLDEQGNMVEKRDFLPYGADRANEATPDSPETDHKFTGKELDSETGLYYYGARYYDPLIGRFIASDTWQGNLSNPQSLNKYAYVLNNPLKFVDPTGMYNMKTGAVEKGDTLGDITGELNEFYGTRYSFDDIATINNIADPNKLSVGQKVRIGTLSGWTIPEDQSAVDRAGWNELSGFQQKLLHRSRNFYQGYTPPEEWMAKSGDQWEGIGKTGTHNIGVAGNTDYRGLGVNAGKQVIYDADGSRVTSQENMGTYDFVPPGESPLGHLFVDVEPWIKWGNSEADRSTKAERIKAMRQDFWGQRGLEILGY